MSGSVPVRPVALLPDWNSYAHTVIGMLHAPPLPGSPRYGGSMERIIQHVLADVDALAAEGVDGLMLENFGDVPFAQGSVDPITVASLTRLACAVVDRCALPLGINVLRNDARSALSIAVATGARFIRVNILSGARLTDQGVITGSAYELLRLRRALGADDVRILADVDVKHSAPLSRRPLSEETEELVQRAGADGVVVSGTGTGKPVNLTDLPEVAAVAGGRPVFVGSGVSIATLDRLLPFCQGLIVGSSLKSGVDIDSPVDPLRVRELMSLVRGSAPG